MTRWMPLLILLPFLELYGLFVLSGAIGLGPTVLYVFLAALVGISLARSEGLRVLWQAQAALARGERPNESLMRGGLTVLGAVLLVIPGILTDLAGLVLLFPLSRAWVVRRLQHKPRPGHATPSDEAWEQVRRRREQHWVP